MASAEINELFNAALEFAQLMLTEEGEFIPFGVSMDRRGKVEIVHGDVGQEHPKSIDVIDLLERTFRDLATEGKIIGAGVCSDVRTVPPGFEEKSDAICVKLAMTTGEAVEVFVPYGGSNEARTRVYGGVFATAAKSFVLQQKILNS